MSKTKSDKIPHYELMYIISNKYAENELDAIKTKVTNLITSKGGEITFNADLGKKRFAYAIKGFNYGYYMLVNFDLAGAAMQKLDLDLKLDTEVLRHQIVKAVKKSVSELQAEASALETRLNATNEVKVAPVVAEAKVEETKTEETTVAKEEVASEEEKPAKKAKATEDKTMKIDSDKELDSKLDNILSSDLLYK